MLMSATAIFDMPNTDLGTAFENHIMANPAGPHRLGGYDTAWLNVLRDRAARINDPRLTSLTDKILGLFANPAAVGVSFRDRFHALYMEAGHHAYPLTWALKSEVQNLAGTAHDFTLNCIDFGLVRKIEDDALNDPIALEFVNRMLALLEGLEKKPHHQVMPGVFEVYSEALVYRLLKQRGGGRLKTRKIKESGAPGPDFECVLRVGDGECARDLIFYVEVKSLDVADAPQRLPEMAEDSLKANIDLERQLNEGKKLATTETEIAPSKRYKAGPEYDPWSVREIIEFLIGKASNNFKAEQFRRGPTFALVGVLRIPLPGQGSNGLAPFFHDPAEGGACVSGVLWNLAFGTKGAPIHRSPEFAGAPTVDGQLERDGLLVDPAITLPAAGMIVLDHYDQQYRLNGLYDSRWTDKAHDWSDLETEEVFSVLCDGYNDRGNGMAHRYSLKP